MLLSDRTDEIRDEYIWLFLMYIFEKRQDIERLKKVFWLTCHYKFVLANKTEQVIC